MNRMLFLKADVFTKKYRNIKVDLSALTFERALEVFLSHPDCPDWFKDNYLKTEFWAGTCSIGEEKFYIAGDGAISTGETRILLIQDSP